MQVSGKASDEGELTRQRVPKWLPVSLLAVTTAALSIPAFLLWRQKNASGLTNSLAKAPPARRANNASLKFTPLALKVPEASGSKPLPPPVRRAVGGSKTVISPQKVAPETIEKEIDGLSLGPLQALGAFGLATAAVGIAAVGGVWGIQKSMGVDNVDQFAARMRLLILEHMPDLSYRIHRRSEDETQIDQPPSKLRKGSQDPNTVESWEWTKAEKRLGDAFDKGGVAVWAEVAMRELEIEAERERTKRGL